MEIRVANEIPHYYCNHSTILYWKLLSFRYRDSEHKRRDKSGFMSRPWDENKEKRIEQGRRQDFSKLGHPHSIDFALVQHSEA